MQEEGLADRIIWSRKCRKVGAPWRNVNGRGWSKGSVDKAVLSRSLMSICLLEPTIIGDSPSKQSDLLIVWVRIFIARLMSKSIISWLTNSVAALVELKWNDMDNAWFVKVDSRAGPTRATKHLLKQRPSCRSLGSPSASLSSYTVSELMPRFLSVRQSDHFRLP